MQAGPMKTVVAAALKSIRQLVSSIRTVITMPGQSCLANNDCGGWPFQLPIFVNAVFIFALICTCQPASMGMKPVARGYVASSHFRAIRYYSVAAATQPVNSTREAVLLFEAIRCYPRTY